MTTGDAEEALRFENLILATLSEVSLDGILIVDSRARILHFNRTFVEMWGIPLHLAAAGDDPPVLQTVSGKVSAPDEFLARIRYLYEHPEETAHDEIALKDGRTFERYSAPCSERNVSTPEGSGTSGTSRGAGENRRNSPQRSTASARSSSTHRTSS